MKEREFDDALHQMVKSEDGSYTAYSKEYDEHYHATKDGALRESLNKHVIPCFSQFNNPTHLNILDICFGLGFNTLATLYYLKENRLNTTLSIYSPELDADLVSSLEYFIYPKAFAPFQEIITALARTHRYEDAHVSIELFVGDAREYLRHNKHQFDIIYQDAFSPKVNPILWTKEYFEEIAQCIKKDGVMSSYSTALAVRLGMFENGFKLYLHEAYGCRPSTMASLSELESLKKVDMAHKIACNPDKSALRDSEI